MHLSLHKKAYKSILLIANGHQEYRDDLINISEQVLHIDPYAQEDNYLESLSSFKEFLNFNKVSCKTNIIYGSGLEDKLEIREYLDNNFTNLISKDRRFSRIFTSVIENQKLRIKKFNPVKRVHEWFVEAKLPPHSK